jgi:hypothetical protein
VPANQIICCLAKLFVAWPNYLLPDQIICCQAKLFAAMANYLLCETKLTFLVGKKMIKEIKSQSILRLCFTTPALQKFTTLRVA